MSTEAAIQKDVVKDEGLDVDHESTTDIVLDEKPLIDLEVKTDRDTIMDQITERRNQEIAKEIGEDESELESELESETEPVVKVKIDGVESTVTEKDIREYQKQRAADTRLEEVNRKHAELAAKEAELEAREAALKRAPAAPIPAPAPVDDTADLRDLSKDLIRTVFAEDEEGVTEIIKKIRGVRQAPAVQPSESAVSEAVNRTLMEKERKEAVKRFSREYAALDSNTGLRDAVDTQTIKERQKDLDADIWTIIDRAAKHVKKETAAALGLEVKDESVAPAVTEKDKRLEAKRGAGPAVKSTATVKASLVKEVPKKLTAFEEIAKARGQA